MAKKKSKPQPTNALPCIICGKELENVFADITNQPDGGTTFITHGHYGSTVFDPMTVPHYLEINLCDDCLVERKENVALVIEEDTMPKRRYAKWN